MPRLPGLHPDAGAGRSPLGERDSLKVRFFSIRKLAQSNRLGRQEEPMT